MCDPVLILCPRRRLSVCKSNELCWTHTDTTVKEAEISREKRIVVCHADVSAMWETKRSTDFCSESFPV